MNKDNFEDRIKNAFDAHRPEADTDAIWQNIEPRLKKKKKRRFIIFLLFGLGLLLLWRECGNLGNGNLEFGNTNLGDADLGSGKEKLEMGNAEIGNTNLTDAANLGSGKEKLEMGNAEIGNTNLTDADWADRADLRNANHANRHLHIEPILPLRQISENESVQNLREKMPRSVTTDLGDADLTERETKDDKKGIEKANEPMAADMAQDNEETNKKKRKRAKKRREPWMHNIGLQAGPAVGLRFMQRNKKVPVPSGLLDGRRATERMMESWAGGFYYSAANRRGLLLQTGLEFRQVNEKFHLAYESVEVDQVNGVLSVTVDAAGNTISQTSGPKTITTTTEYLNTTYNYYRFINLPLGAGYRFTARRSRWELSGGVDINMMLRFRGALYNYQIQPILVGSGNLTNGSIYRRSTGLGLWAAWGCDYQLKGALRWQWGARLQMPLRTVTAPDYALKQRYLHFGAHLGLVWAFKPHKKEHPVKSVEPVLSKR